MKIKGFGPVVSILLKYIWEMVVKLAAISDCIFGDKRWTEPNKYGKINIRNDALKSRVDGE